MRYAMLKLLFLFFFLFSSLYPAPKKETVTVDNLYFQFYKGKPGKWVHPYQLHSSIEVLFKKVGTTETDVKKINDIPVEQKISLKQVIFVPYSAKYTKQLLGENKGRKIIESDKRELIWPIGSDSSYVYISSRIGKRHLGKTTASVHHGIDIACELGTPILAANDGYVERSGDHHSYGLSIVLRHKVSNLKTIYAHSSALIAREGEYVKKGQIIALVGSTGHSTGSHLHFEVKYQDIVLNPEHYFTLPGSEYDEKVVMHEQILD
jgi:murein DD-endopeptidase MepM/ murein hydrolase activator NlpD